MRPPSLTALTSRLLSVNQGSPSWCQPDLAELRTHARDLKKHLNGEGKGGAGGPADRVLSAARAFAATGTLEDCKQARFAAWSLSLSYDPDAPCLFEDLVRFPPLLSEIDQLRSDQRCYRRCWRALLHAYLSHKPDGAGRANWIILRDYLQRTVAALPGPGFLADWVRFIVEHRNLLTDDPTHRYGDDLIDGDGAIVDQIRETLGESDQSWLPASFFEAQMKAIADRDDQSFKSKVRFAIELLQKHQLLADPALAGLLDRYHSCAVTDVNEDLRDYASTRWGPPWLNMNTAKWGRVSDEVRRMVESWLKLDFIEKFFSLLSEDGVNDPRRLIFWRGLHEHIGDMYFALGKTAIQNPSTDFKKIRQTMKGRVLSLDQTTVNNNAFIMQIGGHYFVEFGEKGNALQIYNPTDRPFNPAKSYVSIHDLKDRGKTLGGERLIHKDTIEGKWEWRAIRLIEKRTGLDLSNCYGSYRGGAARRSSTQSRPSLSQSRARASRQQVVSFCELHQFKWQDLTDRGGQFWIIAKAHVGGVTPQLSAWGFSFSMKRQAWYGSVT